MDDRTEILRQLMKLAGISSFQILSDRTGVSRRAIDTLRKGNAATLRYADLAKIAEILQIELTELIATCITLSPNPESSNSEIASLREEYQHLQNQLAHQKQELRSQFEREVIQPTFSRSFGQKNIYHERVRVSEILFSIANFLLKTNIN